MKLRQLLRIDDAVSPVVGVILMVAITVLLVAVVATMTTGMANDAPSQTDVNVQQSAFSFDLNPNVTYSPPYLTTGCPGDGSCLIPPNDAYIGDQLTVTYETGATLDTENIRLRIDGAGAKYINESGYLRDRGAGDYHSNYTLDNLTGAGTLAAGESLTVVTNYGDYDASSYPNPGDLLRNTSIYIIYEGNGEQTVMASWDGPGV